MLQASMLVHSMLDLMQYSGALAEVLSDGMYLAHVQTWTVVGVCETVTGEDLINKSKRDVKDSARTKTGSKLDGIEV